ncbi:MAG: hypothetical protein RL708_905, partial [Bacteroidota bacterium]
MKKSLFTHSINLFSKQVISCLLLFFLFTFKQNVKAQTSSSAPPFQSEHLAYAHEFDKLIDLYGNKIALEDLQVGGEANQFKSVLLCTSGYFNLWFEPSCGMYGNTAIEIARRDVICRVFYDISQFIQRPAGTNDNVNIWVRDIHQIVTAPCGTNGSILG